jgi:hypothetical protein
MRRISELAASALAGSQTGVRLVADVWRGGQLLTTDGPLPVSSWQVRWDANRQVQGMASLTVADHDGTLAPWGWDDVLGAGGSRLHLRYKMPQVGDAEEVSLGWFRIITTDTSESWRVHPTAGAWISTGATISITAAELTWQVQKERFLAPTSPKVTGSAISELRHLVDGIMPLGSTIGVSDRGVSATITYSRERMDAVEDLVASLDAVHRMSEDGVLDLLPATPGRVAWIIAASDDDEHGVLIDLARSQDAGEVPNASVVEGTAPDGGPLIGRAYEKTGPLTFGGPHGRIPAFLSSSVLDTQSRVDNAARSFLARTVGSRRAVLPVTCLPNPALQLYDVVMLSLPVGTLDGPVESMTLAGSAAGVQPMTLGVSVDAEKLAIIAAGVRRGRR